jgi:hypothetical protein
MLNLGMHDSLLAITVTICGNGQYCYYLELAIVLSCAWMTHRAPGTHFAQVLKAYHMLRLPDL